MNILTKEMRRSLKEMDLGLKGKNKSIIGVILTAQRSVYQDGPHGQSQSISKRGSVLKGGEGDTSFCHLWLY